MSATALVITFLSASVGAFITGAFAFLNSPALQEFVSKKLNTTPKQMGKALEASVKLDQLTQELSTLPGVIKGVIMQTNNGGGIPQPGCIIYSSINYPESKRHELTTNMPVGAEFAEYLSRLYQEGFISFTIADLQENGPLRTLFEEARVSDCEVYSLKKYPERFFFLAIDYHDKSAMDNPANKNRLNLLVGKIQSIINHAE